MGFDVHLRGAQRRTGVADDRVRHGAHALFLSVEVRGEVLRGADEAGRAVELRHAAAHRGAVGGEQRQVVAGRVPRVHVDERGLFQVHRHLVGVVSRHAGDADALQDERLELDQRRERACVGEERFLVGDEGAFLVQTRDPQRLCLGGVGGAQDVDGRIHSADDATPEEDSVSDAAVAEALDDFARLGEILVGAALQVLELLGRERFDGLVHGDSLRADRDSSRHLGGATS